MIGKSLAHYEVVSKLGAGGMGEVYRARDSRLDRDVAIKILPESLAHDPERLARFEREAKLLASLNHTNIAAIHGLDQSDSTRFLVLELVEGEDLSERIARGPIPLNDALPIAHQIAVALEEAHRQGITHRDLKPGNIRLTPEGQVKVLDFGLAKAQEPESEDALNLSQSPTIVSNMTMQGVILGTAAYMSPEQSRGKQTDNRTDIWAFGCVLYEMLTALPCFRGETVTDVLTSIIHKEPDFEKLGDTPSPVRRLLKRCLQKDPAHRLQHIGDARLEIEDALAGTEETVTAAAPAKRSSDWPGWLVGGLVGLLLGVGAVTWLLPSSEEAAKVPPVRFSVEVPGEEGVHNPTLSPNGRWLAYYTDAGISVHDLEKNETYLKSAMKSANRMTWFSPDSEWIAFRSGGKLQKMRVTGDVPVELAPSVGTGGSWGVNGDIVYAPDWATGLFSVAADGGGPKQLTELDREAGEAGHWWPQFLPDGKRVLFTVFTTKGSLKHCRMSLLDLQTGDRTDLGNGAYPIYIPGGHLLYHRSGAYELAPFDLGKGEITGASSVVLDQVPYPSPSGTTSRFLSLSNAGVLAYLDAKEHVVSAKRTFYELDRDGRLQRLNMPEGNYFNIDLSPDGKRVATSFYDAGENDIWVFDLERGDGRRVTRESNNFDPNWHPDSRTLAFTTTRLGTFDVYSVDIDSGEPPTPTFTAPTDAAAPYWTPDGRFLVELDGNIVLVEGGKPTQVVASDSYEGSGTVSRDGKWHAYESSRSGTQEIYLEPFDGSASPLQVTSGGGYVPKFSTQENVLYYTVGGTIGDLRAVRFSLSGGRVVLDRPEPFLQGDLVSNDGNSISESTTFTSYDEGPEGSLIIVAHTSPHEPRIHVVLDGVGELLRQASTER